MKETKYEKELDEKVIHPIAEAAAKERANRTLETDAHFSARLRKQMHHSLHELKKHFQHGITILKKHKKWPQDERFEKVAEFLHDESKLNEEISQGKTIQELMQLTDEELVTFYTDGWESYQRESYKEAADVFLFLSIINPKVGSFWSALGAAEEKQGKLQDAVNAYIFAAELETQTLSPYIHGAKCLFLLHKNEEAKKVLHRAIERAEEEPHLKEYKKTAEQMLKLI